MLRSMTGYGRFERKQETGQVTIEVRSVNNRYLDVSICAPSYLSRYEAELKKLVEGAMSRGRVDVRIEGEIEGCESNRAESDLPFARSLKQALDELASEVASPREVTLADMLCVPGVIRLKSVQQNIDEAQLAMVTDALTLALKELDGMRTKEGRAIEQDLLARVSAVEAQVQEVESKAAGMKEVFFEKLKERLAKYAADLSLNEDRLYQEAALLAERFDITEEIVRLKSHNAQFRRTIATEEPAGKKLDFLAQEMGREANTISAKARSSEIGVLTLEIRAEVEKIREQVRNVE